MFRPKNSIIFSAFALVLLLVFMTAGCKDEQGGVEVICDNTPPLASIIAPSCGATGVALNQKINATFNEAMDSSTVTIATFTLAGPSGTPVPGTVSYVRATNIVTFTPTSNLAASTTYTYTIKGGTTGMKDMGGNALVNNFTCSFTTGVAPDLTPPKVTSTDPANNATGVPLSKVTSKGPAQNVRGGVLNKTSGTTVGKIITATFSEAMDPLTINTSTFTVTGPGVTPVTGLVTYSGINFTVNFISTNNLAPSTTYTGTITTGAKDLVGNALASTYVWSFTTGASPDINPPTVTFTDPDNGVMGVAFNKKIAATFSEAMNLSTLNATTFTLQTETTSILGAVTYTGTTALFSPASNLTPNTVYTATITVGAKDLAGNALSYNYIWNFTTGATPDITPPTVVFTDPINNATSVALNKKIAAIFSEAMDPLTITTNTFTVRRGTTSISGTLTYIGTIAVFTPENSLAGNTIYTATITVGAKDLAGNAMASNYVWNFTTTTVPDITPPTVISTDPTNNATGVALNKRPAATFSEAMDPSSITTASVTVTGLGGVLVPGTISYAAISNSLTFTPSSNLASNTTFTVTIKGGVTGAKDLAGNALVNNYVWSFRTADVTPPTVISTDPVNNAIGVALNKKIAVSFSKAMDQSTISATTFTVTGPGITAVPGAVTYIIASNGALFTPTSNLAANTVYTATITIGAKDLAGNALSSNYVWTFTTGAAPDITPPTVISTEPANGATGVPINKIIIATFSEAMDASTITASGAGTFSIAQGPIPLTGSVTYMGTTATLIPTNAFAFNTVYTATISTNAKDLAGNAIVSNYVWSFTTASAPPPPPPPGQAVVVLGTAARFAILSNSAITNIPISAITGDVGLSPGARSSITGLTIPEVTGTIFAADDAVPTPAMLIAAKNDAQAAYLDAVAASRGTPTPISGNINGLTLAPGLYQSGTTIEISPGGFLYLDAEGDVNAVFVIRSATSITTSSTSEVVLTNGAQAKNVFWSAGSAVTLGTNSKMKGTLIASTSISLLTGARLDGRALIQGPAAGQVSLDKAIIVRPPL